MARKMTAVIISENPAHETQADLKGNEEQQEAHEEPIITVNTENISEYLKLTTFFKTIKVFEN